MANYKTKSKDVEAIQFTGANWQEVFDFMGMVDMNLQLRRHKLLGQWHTDGHISVKEDEGAKATKVEVFNWVVKDDNEIAVFTPEEFQADYEPK